ncbi:conserved Plasmodium protein, unknown function [Plasmodium gallinaceum]|uniref:Uncharacterized protein n=1 Tax=Plasmodium gallinaceum TaxID=5849 RepID=A0A1J1GQR1_PLAGA|nr:conserved Plasmodium protein, unknown function [Plasmodium gallinaceum]CRG94760.1 conserved Plasmodium protein, unknown function [Plasmodium gallinaceum]
MEKKKNSRVSSTFNEKLNFNKSYLDLSNYSKANYNKQNSINNTNEICEFFTSITINQKDLSKKYEQLFSLIKKFGKEIKYLLNKNDEYNNLLIDTNEYIKKIKTKLNNSSYNNFENIEVELCEDTNNIDIIAKLITYLFKEVGYYNKNSYELNRKIDDLKRGVGNKEDYTILERKLTLKNEELKKEMINNMSSLKEQQDLKIKIKEDRNIYRKDLQHIYQKFLYLILNILLRDKKYKIQKNFFITWLNNVKNKKKATKKIIKSLCKKEEYLLSYSVKKLKNNCYEIHLKDIIASMLDINANDNKTNYGYIDNIQKSKKSNVYLNFNNNNNNKMKKSSLLINCDNANKTKKSEASIFYGNFDNSKIRQSEISNTYDGFENILYKKSDITKFYDDKNNENNDYDKNNSFYEATRESNYNIEKVYDRFLYQMKDKADKKNVDILHQTIKKLNYKINEIKNTLEMQKKINEELFKNVPLEKISSNYKNSINRKLSDTDYNTSIDNNDSLNILSEKTLSEYLLNKNTSRNMSKNNNTSRKYVIKKKNEDDKMFEHYRKKNSDDLSKKKIYDNIDKWNLNNKYSKNNSMDTVNVDKNYVNQRKLKDNADNIYIKNKKNNIKKDFNDNNNDNYSPSNIRLILRTGGGFRKLSEHDQKNYIEKINFLNDNNLLGYETNLNIKIKGPPFIQNVPNNIQNTFKKEKRHRSLSKFYNMH